MKRNLRLYEEFINERNLEVSLDNEIVGYVDHNDQQAINSIKRIAKSSKGKEEVKTFLSGIGIPPDSQNDIVSMLAGGDWEKASTYILNRTLNVKEILDKKLSSYDINKKYLGITDKKLSDKLFSYQWSTQPPMGKGEAWLSLMIMGGSKRGVGDVEINGINTEVKGMGARIVGQRGYGDAKRMGDHLRNALIHICQVLKIDYIPPEGNGKQWSITKKDSRYLGESLKNMSQIRKGFSNSDIKLISEMLVQSYKNLYTGLKYQNYKDIFVNAISKNGDVDTSKYNTELLKMSFDYYHEVEKFGYFAMTNDYTGNFMIIDPRNFEKLVDQGIVKYSPPSWSERAGTQGGYFSIAIDRLSKR